MLNISLVDKLFDLGAHLGSMYNMKVNWLDYIIGKRYEYDIVDIIKTSSLLKGALFFVNQLSTYNCYVLFHYSEFYKLPLHLKCTFLNIVTTGGQQMITYKWVNGLITNYFFTFYDIIKEITLRWFSKSEYLYAFNTTKNSYWANSFEKQKIMNIVSISNFERKKWLENNFAKSLLLAKHLRKPTRIPGDKEWYRKWLFRVDHNSQKYITKPSNNMRAWYNFDFYKIWYMNDFKNTFLKKKYNKFTSLLIKMFYYVEWKKKMPLETININFKNFDDFERKRLQAHFHKYWRMVLYFKYFKNYYNIPDAICVSSPTGNFLSSNEFISSGLPSIAIIDTDISTNKYTYPIISNDDSIALILYYFTIFNNFFYHNKVRLFNLSKQIS